MLAVTDSQITDYRMEGAVLISGLFKDWVEQIAAGIERNMREPGPYASENLKYGESGRFFDDYCNWQRIPEFTDIVHNSPAAETAARIMGSRTAQFFHDHVLVKEPGTSKATPWHQDAPYYFVDGEHTVSFWIPVEPVEEATLRCIAGSHRWPKLVTPMRPGYRSRISTPMLKTICRFLIPIASPALTAFWNGPCSQVMPSRFTIRPYMVHGATCQQVGVAPCLCAGSEMMLAM